MPMIIDLLSYRKGKEARSAKTEPDRVSGVTILPGDSASIRHYNDVMKALGTGNNASLQQVKDTDPALAAFKRHSLEYQFIKAVSTGNFQNVRFMLREDRPCLDVNRRTFWVFPDSPEYAPKLARVFLTAAHVVRSREMADLLSENGVDFSVPRSPDGLAPYQSVARATRNFGLAQYVRTKMNPSQTVA